MPTITQKMVGSTLRVNVDFTTEEFKSFCPTGSGGGVDPTCKPGTMTVRSGEVLHPVQFDHKNRVWTLEGGKPLPSHVPKIPPPTNKEGEPLPGARVNIHVNLDPKGDLLVQGEDVKGRTQSVYSSNHWMKSAADKFGRVSELRKMRKQIFSEIENDIKSGNSAEEALVTKLIMKTGMRPGGESDTRAEYKSYGATTLEGRHIVEKDDGSISVRYVPGKKKGQEIETPITDVKLGGQLFKRANKVGPDGRLFSVSAEDVRRYSQTKDGGGFKTKDHRTALGTDTAIDAMEDFKVPRTLKEYKAGVKAISIRVSEVLGNTPSIAFKSYIDPMIWVDWKRKAGVK